MHKNNVPFTNEKKKIGVRGKWRARNEYLCLKIKPAGQERCCEDTGSVLASDLRKQLRTDWSILEEVFSEDLMSVAYKKMFVGGLFKHASEMVEKFGNPHQMQVWESLGKKNHE